MIEMASGADFWGEAYPTQALYVEGDVPKCFIE